MRPILPCEEQEESTYKGRPRHLLGVSAEEQEILQHLMRSGGLAQRAAQRARVPLAMSQPQTVVQELAEWVGLTPQGVWEIGQRYKQQGLAVLEDTPRSGRPCEFSPLGASAD